MASSHRVHDYCISRGDGIPMKKTLLDDKRNSRVENEKNRKRIQWRGHEERSRNGCFLPVNESALQELHRDRTLSGPTLPKKPEGCSFRPSPIKEDESSSIGRAQRRGSGLSKIDRAIRSSSGKDGVHSLLWKMRSHASLEGE